MNSKSKVIMIAAILLIALWAIFLRGYQLNQPSYWMDEGYSVNAAISTLEKGYPKLDSGLIYNDHLPSTYAIAGSIKLFGFSNTSTRLPSVIFNLLFLLVIFLFTKRFFGIKVATLTTLFLAFSYWEIAWARQARNYALFQLSFWASLYFFWDMLFYRQTRKNFLLWIFFSLLTFMVHLLGLLLLPIYLVSFLIRYWKDLKQNLKTYLFSRRSVYVYVFVLLIVLFFGDNVWSTIKEALLLKIFYLPNYFEFIKNNFWLVGILALSSFVLYFKNKFIRQKIFILLAIYIIPFVVISFFISLSGHRYLFPALPALYILSSLTIIYLWNKTKTKYIKAAIITTVLLFIIFSREFQIIPKTMYALESNRSPIELEETKKSPRNYYIYTPQPDWELAYAYIKGNKKKGDIVISVQPVFNKIYLNRPEFWIAYSLSYMHKVPTKDVYVGANTIRNQKELRQIMEQNSGFIVLDFLSQDIRIKEDILRYIYENFELVYENTVNYWSRIWIYKF